MSAKIFLAVVVALANELKTMALEQYGINIEAFDRETFHGTVM